MSDQADSAVMDIADLADSLIEQELIPKTRKTANRKPQTKKQRRRRRKRRTKNRNRKSRNSIA